MGLSRTNRHIGRPSVSHLDKKRGTVMAGLASGRSLHNCAQAKFPPISLKGVLFGKRPDRGAGAAAIVDEMTVLGVTQETIERASLTP